MFTYIFKSTYHTNTSEDYMVKLGMDSEQIESVLNQKEFELEQTKTFVRQKRDELLQATDHLMLPDVQSNKTDVTAYRKALRDIPTQAGFPYTVDWPTL